MTGKTATNSHCRDSLSVSSAKRRSDGLSAWISVTPLSLVSLVSKCHYFTSSSTANMGVFPLDQYQWGGDTFWTAGALSVSAFTRVDYVSFICVIVMMIQMLCGIPSDERIPVNTAVSRTYGWKWHFWRWLVDTMSTMITVCHRKISLNRIPTSSMGL